MLGPVPLGPLFSHLTVTVFGATGLRPKGLRRCSNPFVTLQLGLHIHRTATACNTLSPRWNARVTLPLATALDNTAIVTLRVMHECTGWPLSDKFLGCVNMGTEDIFKSGGVKKWFALQSKPHKKPKRRGRIEVALQLCADPSSSLSHTEPQSQPRSICTGRHLSWECCEPQPPSVQTVVGRREPIQPSCAADPGLSERLPSVAAGVEEPVASPLCVSSSPAPCNAGLPSNKLECGSPDDATDEERVISKSTGVTIGTQTSFTSSTMAQEHRGRRNSGLLLARSGHLPFLQSSSGPCGPLKQLQEILGKVGTVLWWICVEGLTLLKENSLDIN
ncbi:uncharacterized protein LOC143527612 [Brachyhypopomus gauderio]|uniref:uncharacterized protein LOC143527612 n=1 Tax=Brachyhypopomus gauderio TaxID=698409 RepID=UPI0040416774